MSQQHMCIDDKNQLLKLRIKLRYRDNPRLIYAFFVKCQPMF